MSDAKQCDRCKKLYSIDISKIEFSNEWWRYRITKDCHPNGEYKLDLCDECRMKLYNWLKGGKL